MSALVQGEMLGGALAGSGQTIGTATTAILSLSGPAAGTAYRLEAAATGFDAANGNAVSLAKAALVRNVAGTVSVAGSVVDLLAALGDAALIGASATFAVSGTNVELRVTGVLAKTINWTASLTYFPTF